MVPAVVLTSIFFFLTSCKRAIGFFFALSLCVYV